ncbi:unnamed protein product [[Candida] boidinii]|uniref:Unnamed protein product n=1 Tax=Candida boidinii TaxID=5477 RepID=A0A9W6WK73_CANBO|nr:unnamed protein product [[Candida] boidinii]
MMSSLNMDLRDSKEMSSEVSNEDNISGNSKLKRQPNLKRFSYHPTSPTTDIEDSNVFEERFSTKSYSNSSSSSRSTSNNSNHQNPLQRPRSVFDNLHSPTIKNSIRNSLHRQKNNNNNKSNEDYLKLEDDFFIGFDPKDEINNTLDTMKDSAVLSTSKSSSSSSTSSSASSNCARYQSSKDKNTNTKQKKDPQSIAHPCIENCENYNPTSLDVIEELLEMLNFQITVINGETYV